MNNLLLEVGINARKSSRAIGRTAAQERNNALVMIADTLVRNQQDIMKANNIDIENAKLNNMSTAMRDRLMLNEERIKEIADSVRDIAKLPDPIGVVLEGRQLPNGLELIRKSTPLGVVGIIYESRPNVTIDCAALCLKSGNASILRGGSEAINSNKKLTEIIHIALEKSGIPKEAVQLIENTDRAYANALMELVGYVDVLIPRGGKALIKLVTENSKVPVIETGAGVCHIYIDKFADSKKAVAIVKNAKMSRPSVCNAVETILVHKKVADSILPKINQELEGVHFKACPKSIKYFDNVEPAGEENWHTEYNDYILNVRIVDDINQAIDHIFEYSTGHSEAIITENYDNSEMFLNLVDSAAVYVNVSTRFTDGGEFGLGAEIGIATQKLHVRGPMGLTALTSSKYIIRGNGQIRN